MKEYYFIKRFHKDNDFLTLFVYWVLITIAHLIFARIGYKLIMSDAVSMSIFVIFVKRICTIKSYKNQMPCNNVKTISIYSCIHALITVCLFGFLFGFDVMLLIMFSLMTIISIFAWLLLNSVKIYGMYIINDEIYYRQYIKKMHIDIFDIRALAVTKSQYESDCACYEKIYNEDGTSDFLYAIVFLNNVEKEMYNLNGNLSFITFFPKNVICNTIYDPRLIDYIKEKNPNVIVMSDIR